LEAKYRHIPINHFQNERQKVKSKVYESTELIREMAFKNALLRIESQGENSLGSQSNLMNFNRIAS
jgi:hypothetical protein